VASTDPYFHVVANLYVVKTPSSGGQSCIEQLFAPTVLSTKVDGKVFNPEKESGSSSEYGKHVFAQKVIRPGAQTIDFSGFTPLFSRLAAAIADYQPI
jgi:hypothetical protein